jgi:hypothetical protein
VPALETRRGVRMVAAPAALDAASVPVGALALRLAPDELFVTGVVATDISVDDPHAIVVDEAGFRAVTLTWDEYDRRVAPLHDWPLPAERPALAQGLVAAVPVKLWLTASTVTIVCATAYAHDLEDRLQ